VGYSVLASTMSTRRLY